RHFIECVQNHTVPETAGEQALLSLRIVENLFRDAIRVYSIVTTDSSNSCCTL
ncbi:hypothetical protein Q6330_27145, partial [Klebsiella pneumoniae]|nr:hypothetical protein [Klebsiella pneumoniae]